ncbi:hypothetical protein B0H98_1202 [Vreelandella songnenensis]|uniref:Uncharacterized protein n=1 Tax=Vreelandella songnenensis TaxID=1176243 RepID=A0A2T0UJR1_9GAMM|nr:hypothetical protein [Halomonas songnenensis]PRY58179.1 hypothetical protein B0H98_1202 [Halomonas songnenensis]
MWFIQPKRDYVAEMPWKYTDEAAIMTWQIRTRDYYTLPANIILLIMTLVSMLIGLWFAFGWGLEGIINKIFISGGIFLFSILITMSMTHQTAIIVYRLTDNRIEAFSWKPQVDSVKPVMKWTAIGSGVVVMLLVFINPGFIVAAIGPVGIGIVAALMGNSKSYQSMARNQMEYEIAWREAKNIYAYSDRNIIGLNLYWNNPDTGEEMKNFVKAIFIPKSKYDDVLDYFKLNIPDAPVIEGKFDVYHV